MTYKLCQERVEIKDSNGMAYTYCMRPKGHEIYDPKGKHQIELTDKDKENARQDNK